MLLQLNVKDFALIDNLTLNLDDHLNVLTGETGAGKSIIIDAVSLLLGGRANHQDIRVGCKKAIVEGIFYLSKAKQTIDHLAELGIVVEEDCNVILFREISVTGKNICRINNRVVTLGNFKEVGSQLINIYGQHDYQAISNKEKHVEFLDSLGDKAFKELKQSVREEYVHVKEAKQAVEHLLGQISSRSERLDFLRFKTHELDEAGLMVGEDEKLEQEILVLDNVEKIVTVTSKVYRWLYADNASAYALISKSIGQLEDIVSYDSQIVELLESLKSMSYILEDSGLTLSRYESHIDFDANRKEQMEERKYVLDRLKKKYNMPLEAIIEENKAYKREIEQLENVEFEVDQAKKIYKERKHAFLILAKQLSDSRKAIAQFFESQLITHLMDLAMTNAQFKVVFHDKKLSANGIDEVEFYISPNPGQPLKPLSQIASGGEMSRIMLAFKTILAEFEEIETLIFDEIDAGIGGNILLKVADKLNRVSLSAQVICVTHAPQIAAFGSKHFKIIKEVIDNNTITAVFDLNEMEQITEIARMLGGEEEYQLKHAQELIKLKNEAFV